MAEEKRIEEEKEIGEEEFLELAAGIHEKIKNSAALNVDGKSAALEVLGGIVNSVKAHGVSQHGLTKRKKQIALVVFEKMSKLEDNSEREKALYNMVVYITLEGIRQAK